MSEASLVMTVGASLRAGRADLFGAAVPEPVRLADRLRSLDPCSREAGAELNAFHGLRRDKVLERPATLHLIHSDTEEGACIASALKLVLAREADDVRLHRIEGMVMGDERLFRRTGMPGFTRRLCEIIQSEREFGRQVLIEATAGFKAMITLAGLVGQALQVPVRYRFEGFSRSVEIPPLPLVFDRDLWFDQFELLSKLDREGVSATDALRLDRLEERVRPLVDIEEGAAALSPMGILFHRGFLSQLWRDAAKIVLPDSGMLPAEKKIAYEDNNPGKHPGLEDFVRRCFELPFVKGAHTWYYNPGLPARSCFRRSRKNRPDQVEAVFSSGGITTKFDLHVTAETPEQNEQARLQLSQALLDG